MVLSICIGSHGIKVLHFSETIHYASTITNMSDRADSDKAITNIQEKRCSFITTNPGKRNLATQILMYLWVVMMKQRFVSWWESLF